MNFELKLAHIRAILNKDNFIKEITNKENPTEIDVLDAFDKKINAKKENAKMVKLEHVGKVYPNGYKAIHDFNLEINPKEFVAFLGPSGCGKTTILRMVAGLETITEGTLRSDSVILNSALPGERNITLVFQNYALYPYMSVYNNIAFGLKLKSLTNFYTQETLSKLEQFKNPLAQKIKNLKHRKWSLAHSYHDEIELARNEYKKNSKLRLKEKKYESKEILMDLKEKEKAVLNSKQKEIESIRKEISLLQKQDAIVEYNGKKMTLKDYKSHENYKVNVQKLRRDLSTSIALWKYSIPGRVNEITDMLGIKPYLNSKPAQLSGGQRQRVALSRSISRNADIFLYDEPLSNLDAKLRVAMRVEIRKLHDMLGSKTIYVTHDQVEAMSMADKIVVIDKGYIQQVGSPNELFDKPSNIFVANFIGTPTINTLDGQLSSKGDLEIGGHKFDYDVHKDNKKLIQEYAGKDIKICFRPQDVKIVPNSSKINNKLSGKVLVKELLGYEYSIVLETKKLGQISIIVNKDVDIKKGEELSFIIDSKKIHLFDKNSGWTLTHKLNKETEKAKEIMENSLSEVIKNNIILHKNKNKLPVGKQVVSMVKRSISKNEAEKYKKQQEELEQYTKELQDLSKKL